MTGHVPILNAPQCLYFQNVSTLCLDYTRSNSQMLIFLHDNMITRVHELDQIQFRPNFDLRYTPVKYPDCTWGVYVAVVLT